MKVLPRSIGHGQFAALASCEAGLLDTCRPLVAARRSKSAEVRQVVGEPEQLPIKCGIVLVSQFNDSDPSGSVLHEFLVVQAKNRDDAAAVARLADKLTIGLKC